MSNWKVTPSEEQFDMIPNFNMYYYLDEQESSNTLSVGYSSQVSAYLEPEQELVFRIDRELPGDIMTGINNGNYLALYINTIFDNIELLDNITTELYTGLFGSVKIPGSTNVISAKELEESDYTIKVDLQGDFGGLLKAVHIIPGFRSDSQYSESNNIGLPQFEYIEWDNDKTTYDENGLLVMPYKLSLPLLTSGSPLEIAYLFDGNMQYLSLLEDTIFTWTTERDIFGREAYYLNIPNTYISSTSEETAFEDGDMIVLRYSTPVEETIQIGIEKMYFAQKITPYDYSSLPAYAELMLINTTDSLNYTSFTESYYYNQSLELTPFSTEYLGTYRDVLIEINTTVLEQYLVEGYIDFSNIIISVPNPAYELTIHEVAIVQKSLSLTNRLDSVSSRVWQFTEQENFSSGLTPIKDEYHVILDETPLLFNDPEGGKWLEYLRIYDTNYNYYTAGIAGGADEDDYQLWYNSTSGNFTWNPGFDRFQDYWGMEIELPALIEPNTTIYFEYCYNNSWNRPIELRIENIDVYSLEVIYNSETILTPRYELWYDELVMNNDDYDYEAVQYYSESFTVYENKASHKFTFETEYNFTQDFLNLTLFEVVASYPNLTRTILKNDDVDYSITFNALHNNITINDLDSSNGLLNQFDLVTVVLNFSAGPISQRTFLRFSPNFNQTYLTDIDSTFYDYFEFSFSYLEEIPDILFFEDAQTIVSDYSSFTSIDYIRNSQISIEQHLKDYEISPRFINFEVVDNPYNNIYEADLDNDGEVDYKQEIDIDKDGRIDITKWGIMNSSRNEIIWYRVVQDFETISKSTSREVSPEKRTEWFSLDYSVKRDDYKFAQRSTQETSITTQTTRTIFYAVSIDNNLDGFTDDHFTYQKRTDSFWVSTFLNEWTAVFKLSDYIESYTKLVTKYYDISDFLSILNDKNLTIDDIEAGYDSIMAKIEGKLNMDDTARLIDKTYTKLYESNLTTYNTDYITQETLTYSNWEKGDLVEVREYSNSFDDRFDTIADKLISATTEARVRTLSITNEEANMQSEINTPLFMITNATSLSWTTDTWGVDNVPIRFETMAKKAVNDDDYEIVNKLESTVNIRLNNRFSLFHDYLEADPKSGGIVGSTVFTVKGVFLTPADGKVFHTSEKYALTSELCSYGKIDGHYLYFDSDDNGFYETVFILGPDDDEDGIYHVISIGYNYDGKHDFIPYLVLDEDEPEGYNFVAKDYQSGFADGKDILWDGDESVMKTHLKVHFPKAEFDNYIPKDQIFEVSKLLPGVNFSQYAPSLFFEVYTLWYGETWNIYMKSFESEVWSQVEMIATAAVGAAVVGMVSAIIHLGRHWAGIIAGTVFAIIYFFETQALQAKKREISNHQLSSHTYYNINPSGTLNEDIPYPTTLNEKRAKEITSLWEHQLGHPSAKFVPVSDPEGLYKGEIIVTPPDQFRNLGMVNAEYSDYPDKLREMSYEQPADYPFGGESGPDGGNTGGADAGELEDRLSKTAEEKEWDKNAIFYQKMLNNGLKAYTGLDYPLVSSELYAYNQYSYYQFTPRTETFRTENYALYPLSSIGALESAVAIVSDNKYNTIRPYSINGRPAYVFIDENDRTNNVAQPRSALYQPIVISQERYDELRDNNVNTGGVVSVIVKTEYYKRLHPFFAALYSDVPQGIEEPLTPSEIEKGYKVKVPLLSKNFGYPITKVTLDILALGISDTPQDFATGFEINEQDYIIEGGNLYFTISLDDFVLSNHLNGIFFAIIRVCSYRVNVYIETVVPYPDPNQESIPNRPFYEDIPYMPGMSAYYYQMRETLYLDTTSNDLAKTALAQATSYLISDYFNVHTLAIETSQSQAERDYTEYITRVSTLITTVILLPLTVISAGLTSAIRKAPLGVFNTMMMTGIKYIATIPLQVETEVWEELYLDPAIESFMLQWAARTGTSREVAEFWASFVCSFREAGIGAVSSFISDGIKGQDSLSQLMATFDSKSIELETTLALAQEGNVDYTTQVAALEQSLSATNDLIAEAKKGKNRNYRSLLDANRVFSILGSMPSFFVGGGGMATMTQALDLTVDILFDIELGRLLNNRVVLDPLIDKLEEQKSVLTHTLDLTKASDLLFQVKKASQISISGIPAIKPLNPLQTQSQTVQLQSQSEILSSLGITTSYNEYVKNEQAKENTQKIKMLERSHQIQTDLEVAIINQEQMVTVSYGPDEAYNLFGDIRAFSTYSKKRISGKASVEESLEGVRIMYNERGNIDGLIDKDREIGFKWNGYYITKDGVFTEDHYIAFPNYDEMALFEILDILGYEFTSDWATNKDAQLEIVYMDGNPIHSSNDFIKDKFPYYYEFVLNPSTPNKHVFRTIFKGKLDKMAHAYEDLEILDSLFKFVKEEAKLFTKDNFYNGKGEFDSVKFKKLFKNYFNLKWKNVKKDARNSFYDVVFEPGLEQAEEKGLLEGLALKQTQFLILDIIMKDLVNIDAGTNIDPLSIIGRIEKEMDKFTEVSKFMRKKKFGRPALFEIFSEGFFDTVPRGRNPQLIIFSSITQNIIGRYMESRNVMEDLPNKLAVISQTEQFVAWIGGIQWGNGRGLGLNDYFLSNGIELDSIETALFGADISGMRQFLQSNSAYLDAGAALLTESGLYSTESKNTQNQEASEISLEGIARDLMRSSLILAVIEGKNLIEGTENAKLKDLRKLGLTASVVSLDGPNDLSFIINAMASMSRFSEYVSGSGASISYKMPSLYILLSLCANVINEKIASVGSSTMFSALNYINSQEFLNEIESLIPRSFNPGHINDFDHSFFVSIQDFFSQNFNSFATPNLDNTGLELSFSESFNMLFKKVDNRQKQVKRKVSDLPSDIKIYEDGKWIKFSDSLKLKYPSKTQSQIQDMDLDSAYIIIHGKDGNQIINGLYKIDNVKNTLPFGIKEGFYDHSTENVIHNVFISDAYGNFLYSAIEFESHQTMASIKVRNANWQVIFTNTDNRIEKNVYITFSTISGSQFTCFLFDTTIDILAKQPFNDFFKGKTMPRKAKTPKVKLPTLNRGKLNAIEPQLKALFGLFYQMEVVYGPQGFKYPIEFLPNTMDFYGDLISSDNLRVKTEYREYKKEILTDLFSLHSDSKITYDHVIEVFKALKFTSSDLNYINTYFVSTNELKNGASYPREQGWLFRHWGSYKHTASFYRIILERVVDNKNINLLKDFKDDLYDKKEGKYREISLTSDLTDKDLENIEIINYIMDKLIGFSALTLIKLGIVNIWLTESGYDILPILPARRDLGSTINEMGIKPLSTRTNTPYVRSFFNTKEPYEILKILSSILIYGYSENVKVGNTYHEILILPSTSTLSVLYSDFRFGKQNYMYYTKPIKEFLNLYSDLTNSKLTGDTAIDFINAIFKGKERMALLKFIDYIENAFTNFPFDVNKDTLPYLFETLNLNLQKVGFSIINRELIDLDAISNKMQDLFKTHDSFTIEYLIATLGIKRGILLDIVMGWKGLIPNAEYYLIIGGERVRKVII